MRHVSTRSFPSVSNRQGPAANAYVDVGREFLACDMQASDDGHVQRLLASTSTQRAVVRTTRSFFVAPSLESSRTTSSFLSSTVLHTSTDAFVTHVHTTTHFGAT